VAKQANELRYAVRFRVVFKYFGQMCLLLATLMRVPLVISVIFSNIPISLRQGLSDLESRANGLPQHIEVPPNMVASPHLNLLHFSLLLI
jgi:hypothetical protein